MKPFPMKSRRCRGRRIAWSRTVRAAGSDGPAEVTYQVFQRDSEGKVYVQRVVMMAGSSAISDHAAECRRLVAQQIRAARAQLRWSVDQVEFQRLGLVDTTPCPMPWALQQNRGRPS